MRKFWQSILCLTLVTMAIFSSFACSNAPKTSQSSINLQQMANDIDNLKSSFSVLNTAFANLKIGDSVSVSSFDTLKGDFLLLKAKVDLIETPKQEVTQAELDILAAQVSTISNSVSSLSAQLTALDNELSVVQSDVASLKTSVAALQNSHATTPPTTTAPTTSGLTCTITPIVAGVPTTLNNTNPQVFTFGFTCINASNVAANNVRFNISFVTNSPNTNDSVILATVGATTPVWLNTLHPGSLYTFNNWPLMTVGANQTINLLLTLTVDLGTGGIYYFYPQANIAS